MHYLQLPFPSSDSTMETFWWTAYLIGRVKNLYFKIKVLEQAELSRANQLRAEENKQKLLRTAIVQTEVIRTDISRTLVYTVSSIPTCFMLPYW
jgi:hypothetical protein